MSFGELLFLAVLALLVFGPRKLPEIAGQIAKVMAELRKASNEFRYQLEDELHNIEASEAKQKRMESPAPEGSVARGEGRGAGDEGEDALPDSEPAGYGSGGGRETGAEETGNDSGWSGGTAANRESGEESSYRAEPGDSGFAQPDSGPWDEASSAESDPGSWEAAVFERDCDAQPPDPGTESGAGGESENAPGSDSEAEDEGGHASGQRHADGQDAARETVEAAAAPRDDRRSTAG